MTRWEMLKTRSNVEAIFWRLGQAFGVLLNLIEITDSIYKKKVFRRKDHGCNRPFPSSLVPLFENESNCETFHVIMSSACSFIFMQISHFHENSIALRLALIQRHKGTRKSPIANHVLSRASLFYVLFCCFACLLYSSSPPWNGVWCHQRFPDKCIEWNRERDTGSVPSQFGTGKSMVCSGVGQC